jgi:CrcB protein
MVGVLGGFTTFSTFSYDTVTLLSDGVPAFALAYSCGSVILGILAAMAGMGLARIALHAT